jgi:hypothetical protein
MMLALIPLGLQEFLTWSAWVGNLHKWDTAREEYLPLFLEDQDDLSDIPFFDRGKETTNAAALLNSRVPWISLEDGTPQPLSPERRGVASFDRPLYLPDKLRALIKKWGKEFPQHHSELRYGRLEFTWMHDLLAYDYWDISEASPIEEMFGKGTPVGVYLTQRPMPDYFLLLDLAKVRLMKGLFEGYLETAIQETHHLARLAYTTEDLAGVLTAVGILQAEADVETHLSRHFHVEDSDIEPFDEDTLKEARRAIQAYSGLFSITTPEEILETIFGDPKIHVGYCAALSEGMLRALLTRPLLEPRLPFERDYRSQYAALDDILKANANRCRLKQLKSLWERRDAEPPWAGLFRVDGWNWVKWDLYRFVPYFRKGLGLMMTAVFLPRPFPGYEKTTP